MALSLREVSEKDFRQILEWRNNPETRNQSFQQKEIPFEEHVRYWKQRLADKEALSYMVLDGGRPVGVLRINKRESFHEIDIFLDPKAKGKGLGTEAIRLAVLLAKKLGLKRLGSRVKPGNPASEAVFLKNGFKKADSGSEDYYLFEMEL